MSYHKKNSLKESSAQLEREIEDVDRVILQAPGETKKDVLMNKMMFNLLLFPFDSRKEAGTMVLLTKTL